MGPLVMTGLAAMGATIGMGWIIASTTRPPTEARDRRVPTASSFAIIVLAFCQSIAILAVVAGLLAIFTYGRIEPGDQVLVAGLAVIGALAGAALIVRARGTADPRVVMIGSSFIGGPAVLGIVVAVLSLTVSDVHPKHPIEGPFALLGVVSLGAALAVGALGARAIRSMEGADDITIRAISSRSISRIALVQIAGIGPSIVAIFLVMTR